MQKTCFVLLYLVLATQVALAEIKIGWIGPLTGNAAVLGVDSVPAIQIAFEQLNASGGINGQKLRLVVEDDQYQTAKTISAYHRLVHSEGIKILFALTYGGVAAIAQKAEKDGVIIIDTLDCDENMASLPPNTICIAKTTESMGRGVAELIIAKNDTPTAVIYFDGDPFMGILADSLTARLKLAGITPKIIETYNDNSADFRTLAAKIKSAGNIKSVVLLGYDQIGRAARSIREIGLSSRFYGVNTATSPGFQELAGSAADGMLGSAFRAPPSNQPEDFRDRFVKKVGHPWQFETSAIPSFDAAMILGGVLKSGGFDSASSSINVTNIRQNLLAVKDYHGVSGMITIDADGVTRSLAVVPVRFAQGVSNRL